MRLRLYRKLKGANPANSIVGSNLSINGVESLAPDGIDSENLFVIGIYALETKMPQIKKAVVDAIVNPNQYFYLLTGCGKKEGNLKRRGYEATVSVETDYDPEAISCRSALRARYELGEAVVNVTKYVLWHLTFRDPALTPEERRRYAEQLRDFFANPNFQKARIKV